MVFSVEVNTDVTCSPALVLMVAALGREEEQGKEKVTQRKDSGGQL